MNFTQNIISKRFVEACKLLISNKERPTWVSIAKELDIKAQTLSEITKGRRDVTLESIRKFLIIHKSFSPTWFILGIGDRFLSDSEKEQKQEQNPTSTNANSNNQELEMQLRFCSQERQSIQQRLESTLIEQGKLTGANGILKESIEEKEKVIERQKIEMEVLLQSNGELKANLEEVTYQASEMYSRLKKYNDTDGIKVNSLSA